MIKLLLTVFHPGVGMTAVLVEIAMDPCRSGLSSLCVYTN